MTLLIVKKLREKRKAKEKAEREYASKQASVDTEINKPTASTNTNTGGRSTKQASVDTEIGKTATGTTAGGRSAQRSVATGGSPKDNLRIKRKNYSSMYSGAGRNIV